MREHRHIRVVLDWIGQYRTGQLDEPGFLLNVRALSGALEGDMPKPARQAIMAMEEALYDVVYAWESTDILNEAISRLEKIIEDSDSGAVT